jgi:hypothetical protein
MCSSLSEYFVTNALNLVRVLTLHQGGPWAGPAFGGDDVEVELGSRIYRRFLVA